MVGACWARGVQEVLGSHLGSNTHKSLKRMLKQIAEDSDRIRLQELEKGHGVKDALHLFCKFGPLLRQKNGH